MCLGGCLGLQQRTPCIAVFVSRRGAEHRDIHRYRSYVTIRMDNTRQADSENEATRQLCVLCVSAWDISDRQLQKVPSPRWRLSSTAVACFCHRGDTLTPPRWRDFFYLSIAHNGRLKCSKESMIKHLTFSEKVRYMWASALLTLARAKIKLFYSAKQIDS